MPADTREFKEALSSAFVRIAKIRGLILEGRFFEQALSHTRLLVRSVEFARCDGAVVVGKPSIFADHTANYFRLYEDFKTEEDRRDSFILFDVKSIDRQLPRQNGIIEAVRWTVCLTATQSVKAQFIFVVTNNFGGFVGIVPRQILESFRKKPIEDGKATAFSLGHFKAAEALTVDFPPRIQGWMLPYSHINEALERIINCSRDSRATYCNPWTGVEATGWTPTADTFVDLLPPKDSQRSFDRIFEIFKALNQPARKIHMRFMATPMVGDFAIHETLLLNQTATYVFEHKLDHLHQNGDRMRHALRRDQNSRIFRNKIMWDFFWTESKNVAFVIPRDCIPKDWLAPADWSDWFYLDSPLQEFRVTYDDANWVERVLEIVHTYGNAKYELTIGSGDDLDDQESDSHAEEEIIELSDTDESDGDESFAGRDVEGKEDRIIRRRSLAELRKKAASVLQHLQAEACERGCGVAFWMGWNHTMGPVAIARYEWTEREKENFKRRDVLPVQLFMLPPSTPVVIIQFNQWRPTRYTQSSVGGIYGRNNWLTWHDERTMNICFPPESLKEQVDFPAPFIVAPSEAFLVKGAKTAAFTYPFEDAYRLLRFNLDELYPVVMQFFSTHETERLGIAGIKFKRSRYMHSVREVLQNSSDGKGSLPSPAENDNVEVSTQRPAMNTEALNGEPVLASPVRDINDMEEYAINDSDSAERNIDTDNREMLDLTSDAASSGYDEYDEHDILLLDSSD